jgi:ribosome-binding factor A
VERRGQKYHRERLGGALREEIATILEGELSDPRIGLVTVSEVQLAPDSKSARVLVAIDGDERHVKETMNGLVAATGYIRRELTERLQLRRAPELIFQVDRSQESVERVEELLGRTRRKTGNR